jgi:hypothetical protein
VPIKHAIVFSIAGEGLPDDSVAEAKAQLVRDLNDQGPIATPVSAGAKRGEKGDLVTVGQIGLALISAGLVQQVARVIVEFIKRNQKYTIQIGNIKVTRDHASNKDIETINKELKRLLSQAKTKIPEK